MSREKNIVLLTQLTAKAFIESDHNLSKAVRMLKSAFDDHSLAQLEDASDTPTGTSLVFVILTLPKLMILLLAILSPTCLLVQTAMSLQSVTAASSLKCLTLGTPPITNLADVSLCLPKLMNSPLSVVNPTHLMAQLTISA